MRKIDSSCGPVARANSLTEVGMTQSVFRVEFPDRTRNRALPANYFPLNYNSFVLVLCRLDATSREHCRDIASRVIFGTLFSSKVCQELIET